jgi:hypothetical protein
VDGIENAVIGEASVSSLVAPKHSSKGTRDTKLCLLVDVTELGLRKVSIASSPTSYMSQSNLIWAWARQSYYAFHKIGVNPDMA